MLRLKKVFFVLGCIVLYLFFLIILVPANVVASWLPLPKEIQIGQVSGSIWQGQATNIVILGQSIETLNWSLSLTSLTPALKVDIVADSTLSAKGDILLTNPVAFHEFELTSDIGNLHQRVNAFIIENQSRFPKNAPAINQFNKLPLKLSGQINLKIDELVIGFAKCQQLQGNLKMRELEVNFATINLDLGEIKTPLMCENNQLVINLVQESNELISQIAGRVEVKTGDYQLNGYIEKTNSTPNSVQLLIKSLPKEEERHLIKLNGRL